MVYRSDIVLGSELFLLSRIFKILSRNNTFERGPFEVIRSLALDLHAYPTLLSYLFRMDYRTPKIRLFSVGCEVVYVIYLHEMLSNIRQFSGSGRIKLFYPKFKLVRN